MGSHHHQAAILFLDDKLDCFGQLAIFYLVKNGLAFHPGPVLPSRTDGSSFHMFEFRSLTDGVSVAVELLNNKFKGSMRNICRYD